MQIFVDSENIIRIAELLYCRMKKLCCMYGIAKKDTKFLHSMSASVDAEVQANKFFLFLREDTAQHIPNLAV